MEIAKQLLDEIINSLPQNWSKLYNDYFLSPSNKITQTEFKTFAEDIVIELVSNIHLNPITKHKRQSASIISKTKKRWLKLVVDEYSSYLSNTKIRKERFVVKDWSLLNWNENNLLSTDKLFQKIVKEDNIDDYYIRKINEIEKKWAANPNSVLCCFDYLNSLSKTQVSNAFKHDITKHTMNYLEDHYGGDPSNAIYYPASILLDYPIFGTKKNIIGSDNGVASHTYNPTDSIVMKFEVDHFSDDNYSMKLLDSIDYKLIQFLFFNIDNNFESSGTVLIDIKQASQFIFGNKQKKNIRNLSKRLLNLQDINIKGTVHDDDNDSNISFSIGFFQEVYIYEDKNKSTTASVKYTEKFKTSTIEQQSNIGFLSNIINKLEISISPFMLALIQEKRAANRDQNNMFEIYLPFQSIIERVRIEKRYKKDILKEITLSLDEIINSSNFIISYTFNKKSEIYVILCNPYSESERYDYKSKIID